MINNSIAILVLFYEKAGQTVDCLKGFADCPVNIYLLDNGSSPEAKQIVHEYLKGTERVRLIELPENIGSGPGRNRLIEAAEEEWLFFADNDIVVETPDWFERVSRHIQSAADAEVMIPRLYNWHERQWVVYSDFQIDGNICRRAPLKGQTINNFPGGAAIVKRSLFSRLGMYDEDIFVGGEEYEFCLRGLLAGEPVKGLLIDDVCLIHKHLPARDAVDVTAARVRYNEEMIIRNIRYIEQKFGVFLQTGSAEWARKELRLMTGGESAVDRMKRHLTTLRRRLFSTCR